MGGCFGIRWIITTSPKHPIVLLKINLTILKLVMKNLYLIRGVSGAGKSTFGQSLCTSTLFDKHIEADQYFIDKEGNYNWDLNKLGQAHGWCQEQVETCMKESFHRVVVTNTATRESDLNPYYKLAKKYGYRVFSIILENRHGGKDVHGVPEQTLTKMEEYLRNSIKLR